MGEGPKIMLASNPGIGFCEKRTKIVEKERDANEEERKIIKGIFPHTLRGYTRYYSHFDEDGFKALKGSGIGVQNITDLMGCFLDGLEDLYKSLNESGVYLTVEDLHYNEHGRGLPYTYNIMLERRINSMPVRVGPGDKFKDFRCGDGWGFKSQFSDMELPHLLFIKTGAKIEKKELHENRALRERLVKGRDGVNFMGKRVTFADVFDPLYFRYGGGEVYFVKEGCHNVHNKRGYSKNRDKMQMLTHIKIEEDYFDSEAFNDALHEQSRGD